MTRSEQGSKENKGMWINVRIVETRTLCDKSYDVDNLATMQTIVDNTTIDHRIDQLTDQWMRRIIDKRLPDSVGQVLEQMRFQALSCNAHGKRLRARLALAAFETGLPQESRDGMSQPIRSATIDVSSKAPVLQTSDTNSPYAAMLDLACAIELYQTSALIHDDLIDDSVLRRGQPSAHAALGRYAHDSSTGKGLALMLGDMLATASIETAKTAALRPGMKHGMDCLETFLSMQQAVEIGQSLDLQAQTLDLRDPKAVTEAALSVYEWKTASYTTIAPIELGLTAAGIAPEMAHKTAYGMGLPLGLAFQLADDLIDVISDSGMTGKPQGGDIREGKRTVLLADTLSKAQKQDRQALIAMYQAPTRDENDVAFALRMFNTTGAVASSRERIATLWREVQGTIGEFEAGMGFRADLLRTACERFIPLDLRQ
jgi:geranylgeranyl diphosphate synthase, type I